MMKIGILTYYFVHNYGAILQAYGVQCVLESMGHEPVFLTFSRNYDHLPVGAEKKYNLSIKSVPLLTKYFFDNGAGTFYYNYIKRNRLHAFSTTKMKMGERYSDAKKDAVLIGSDEVFAIDVGLNPFLFGHDIPVDNIFSYAASFGSSRTQDIRDAGCEEVINSGLRRLSRIGVRDITTKNMVEEISGCEATLNCDPVILYGYHDEIEKARAIKPKENYIIIYSYDRNFNSFHDIEAIKKFAIKERYKIYSVGYYHKWCDKNIMCSPIEMIDYFCNAKLVVTDTFHGSVISIITNTPLMVRLTKQNQKVEYLLSQYGLEDHLTNDINDINRLYQLKTDYKKINEIVAEERRKSLKYLQECLE